MTQKRYKRNEASEAYHDTHKAIVGKLQRLQKAAQAHTELVSETKVGWGMVGDLQRLDNQLDEILEWME